MRDFFRNSSWNYSHGGPTLVLVITIFALLFIRVGATTRTQPSPRFLRFINGAIVVACVVFTVLIYARFVTLVS